jgi:predicted dehydrogenase
MTSKPKVRAGIVGSGFAASLHYEGIHRVYGTDVDLVGIFSPTAENARRFAEPRGLRTFSSLEALLGEVEVVHVCASPAAHEPIAVAALARGVNAIVEKPLTGWFGDGSPAFHASGASMNRRSTARSPASTACWRPRQNPRR